MRNATELLFVIDESGSMSHLQMDTVEQLNNFIRTERDKNGECRISILKFDDPTRITYIRRTEDIRLVKSLSTDEYKPTGVTALYDALGKGIEDLGARLSSMREADRPDKVVIVVITDGCENASAVWSLGQLKTKIKEQEEKYNWKFVFLGKGLDVVEQAKVLAFQPKYTAHFGNTTKDYRAAYATLTSNISKYRQTGDSVALNFTEEQRKQMYDDNV